MDNTHTPGPWFPVEYAGYWCLQSGPYYEDQDIFNIENNKQAEDNAKLAASAPDLLQQCAALKVEVDDLIEQKVYYADISHKAKEEVEKHKKATSEYFKRWEQDQEIKQQLKEENERLKELVEKLKKELAFEIGVANSQVLINNELSEENEQLKDDCKEQVHLGYYHKNTIFKLNESLQVSLTEASKDKVRINELEEELKNIRNTNNLTRDDITDYR